MVKKIALITTSLVLLGLIFIAWWPLGRVFYQADIPIGNDTINFVYYVDYLRDNLAFPVLGWKYQAFEGMPLLLDQSWLNFYLVQPLIHFLGIFLAIKAYVLFFFFLFFVFAYLLFYEISGNLLLSAGLTLLLARTGAVYLPLYSSGVVLSSISHTFYAMMLYFLVRFAKRNEKKSLYLAALALSLSVYTHPGIAAVVLFAAALFFFIFYSTGQLSLMAFKKKFSSAFIFFFLFGLVSSLGLFPYLYSRFTEGGLKTFEFNFSSSQITFSLLRNSLNPVIFLAAGIALIFGLLFINRLNRLVWPFLVIFVYLLVFLWTLYVGRNPLGGFMFPHRLYWALVLTGLAIVALLVSPSGRENFGKTKRLIHYGFTYVLLPLVLVASLLQPINKTLNFLGDSTINGKVWHNQTNSDPGKVYGERILSAFNTDLAFFKEADLSYRLYIFDYIHNLSLGMITPVPQTRGANHFMTAKNADWFAWFDAVFAQESQTKQRLEPYVAEQQSVYLLDWYAVRYLFSYPGEPGMLANWFVKEDSPYVEARNTRGPNVALKIKEEFTSPIIKPSRAKVIGFIGSQEGYDSFVRNLGVLAYDSEYVIPIRAGEYLEEISEDDLINFDGLFIYSYREKNKEKHLLAWEKIEDFVNNGGTVLVDTGSYSPEKYLDVLPEIFPVKSLVSGSVGTSWSVSSKSDLFGDLDFSQLSPLTYEEGFWAVDYAQTLQSGAREDLSLNGKIVVASKTIGRGNFYWSGLNCLYRVHYFKQNAQNEIGILKVFLDKSFGIQKEISLPFTSQRPKSEKVIVAGQNAKGVLFKENNYGGWLAKATFGNAGSENLKIYPAGTEFMYVRFPQDKTSSKFDMVFEYKGKTSDWIFLMMTLLGLILTGDGLLFNFRISKIGKVSLVNFFSKPKNRIGSWWEKDEEAR